MIAPLAQQDQAVLGVGALVELQREGGAVIGLDELDRVLARAHLIDEGGATIVGRSAFLHPTTEAG